MMKRILLLMMLAVAAFSVSCRETACDGPSMEQMRNAFRSVPDETPLAVYWYWVSDNISEEGVVRDLESMKEVGINRAFIGNIGIGDQPYGGASALFAGVVACDARCVEACRGARYRDRYF